MNARRRMTLHLFDDGNIYEGMWNSTLSNIVTFDDSLRDSQVNAEMQIYRPATLSY
jgi:hypothetical protein